MATEARLADPQKSLPQTVGSAISAAWRRGATTLRFILRTTSGRIALPIVLFHLVLVLVGRWLAPYPYAEFQYSQTGDLQQFLGPSAQFWLGTDQFGRDILSRIMSGATSLIVIAGLGTALGVSLGTMVGMSSGYRGGGIDAVIMRVMDGLMSFPSLLLALLVVSSLGANQVNILATVGIVTMPRVARVVRSVTLTLKELEFVQSARLRGEHALYIIFREILPNTMSVLGVELSVRLSYSILTVASLGFLGLGVQPPSPDWGLMISQSRGFLNIAPWVALAPAGAVVSLVVGVNLLTDSIRQASGLPLEDKP
jgi:peptide/nickel transport system permease protein